MRIHTLFFATLATAVGTTSVFAEDQPDGAVLHNQACQQCHNSDVYTRENRRITNLVALDKQVNRCKDMLQLTWFDDEVAAVSAYLNQNYYHFPAK